MLGLTVGVIQTPDRQDQRRRAYACDVTYGTAKEFGFDFLRDRLLLRRMGRTLDDFLGDGSSPRWDDSGEQPVQRGAHFALVDEADSILIDEARTRCYGSLGDKRGPKWSRPTTGRPNMPQNTSKKKITITIMIRAGRVNGDGAGPARADILRGVGLIDLYEYTERAIKVIGLPPGSAVRVGRRM
jgi:preprotein translocase subunit SecA